MFRTVRSILVVSFVVASCGTQMTAAAMCGLQETFPSDAPNANITARRTIEATAFFDPSKEIFYTYVTLEPVPAGEKIRLALTITNGLEAPLLMKLLKTTCGCASVKFPQGVLEGGQSVVGELSIDLPTSSMTGGTTIALEFFDDPVKSPIGTINIVIPLSGCLSLDTSRRFFEIDQQLSAWRIPVMFTAPITFESIEIEKSDALQDVVLSLVKNEKEKWVEMSVADSMVGPRGISGSFKLLDKSRGVSTEPFHISLIRMPPLRISPLLLRFRPDAENPGRLVASSLLQQNHRGKKAGELEQPGATGESVEPPETIEKIGLIVAGKPVDVDSKPLGTSGVLKLRVSAFKHDLTDKPAAEPTNETTESAEPVETYWTVRTNRSIYKIPVTFLLD